MSRTSKKQGHGVPKWFKRLNRQEERAKQNQALRVGRDIPIFKTRDKYEYW